MPLDVSSNSAQILMTAIYGIASTIIGVVGIYQGRRVWKTWYEHHHGQESHAAGKQPSRLLTLQLYADPESDIELGQSSSQPTAPSSESAERGATIDSSRMVQEEHPVAVSIIVQAVEGDHVVDKQIHTRTLAPQREAFSTQSPNPLPHIMVERHELAA